MPITEMTSRPLTQNLEFASPNQAKVLSKNLMGQLEGRMGEIEGGIIVHPIGYYRNSIHSLSNLVIALNEFSKTNNLDSKINATSAHGMGSWPQPDTVRETFKWAINPQIHGGIIQTITAMKNSEKDLEIALVADEIVSFLKSSNIL